MSNTNNIVADCFAQVEAFVDTLPVNDECVDLAEHREQTRQMEEEQAAEWAAYQEELQQEFEPDQEEIHNDWYDETVDFGE